MEWKEAIYEAVKTIPKGRISTYGKISEYINGNWKMPLGPELGVEGEIGKSRITARMVGYALHNNPDPENIPCHRVVDRNGKLAENFAFGGWKRQKELLLEERVTFKDKMHVDFVKDRV